MLRTLSAPTREAGRILLSGFQHRQVRWTKCGERPGAGWLGGHDRRCRQRVAGSRTWLASALTPPELFFRCLAAPSLLAHLVMGKYCEGLPLFRLEQRFARDGVPVDRGTMARWMEDVGATVGTTVVAAMREEALATAFCIATDATGVAVQPVPVEGQRQACRRGHYFVQVVDRDAVFFEYTPKETSAAVLELFKGFSGYVQADAKSVFTWAEAKNYVAELSSNLDFIKGWGGSVVNLGAAAPAGTNGLIAGFHYAGYRWLKQDGTTHKFWDGTAWQPLPTGFALRDSNNFCVGFYKDGTTFRSQYGGEWPESFTDYSLSDPGNQAKLTAWKGNIEQTWSSANSRIGIRRAGCPSTKKECCRYEVKTSVAFNEKACFTNGLLVVADGNIRSNDQLWFLDEPRVAVAAHEFGHHIGNPDEYAGAVVDTSLNDDGATNGIDPDSIMGQQLTKVKKRHYRTICKHMAALVQNQICQTYTYEPVDL